MSDDTGDAGEASDVGEAGAVLPDPPGESLPAPPTKGTPSASRSRSRVVLIAVGAGLVILVLLGGGLLYATSRTETLTGSVGILDLEAFSKSTGSVPDFGDKCTPTGGYSDLQAGAQVTVRDGAGALLATGKLEEGTWTIRGCTLPFTVEGIGRSDFYEIGVGSDRRGSLAYSREEIEAKGWEVELTIS